MIHNLISCVFVHRTNFVCLPDRASLSISSSKTPFPFYANADPSLCALHSFPTQPITSWPVMGEMAHFCLNSSLALYLVPWHIQQTQSVNTRKPSEAEDKQRSQSPAVRPTRAHTHSLWSMRKAECLCYLWLGFHEQKPHPVWMTIWSFTWSQRALGNAVLGFRELPPFLLRFQV